MTDNFKFVSHIFWMNVISFVSFLLARFSPRNRNCIWNRGQQWLIFSLHVEWQNFIYVAYKKSDCLTNDFTCCLLLVTVALNRCNVLYTCYSSIFTMHCLIFIPHFGKPLLSGQLLWSCHDQLAHFRGWVLNRGLTVMNFSILKYTQNV